MAAACSGPNEDCSGTKCGEDNLVDKLGGKPEDVVFTMPVRPRTGQPIEVCTRWQLKYELFQFSTNTPFQPDGRWSK